MVITKRTLKDINLEIKPGELIAVVGLIASGKSSLLQALTQNMHYFNNEDSSVSINGKIAYSGQETWIQNKTIKENILFGNFYDEQKYLNVLNVCMLNKDLSIFPGGDLTEIGEKGINLSGGQKARLSLARAVYSNADIYLFDDPLSALDQYVGVEVFEKCILKHLKGKTRIFVTNNQQLLSYTDRIIVMNEGKIAQFGCFNELIVSEGYFKNVYMADIKQTQIESKPENKEESSQEFNERKLVESEDRAIGKVNFFVYKTYYFYAGGLIVIVLTVFAMFLWQSAQMITNIYLAEWTNQSASEQRQKQTENILIYVSLIEIIYDRLS